MTKLQNFKQELSQLLDRYSAIINCDVEGDTFGLQYEMTVQFKDERYTDHKLCDGYQIATDFLL